MPMFDKLRPAVTVAAQHLQNNMKSKDKEQAPVQSTTARLGGLTGQTKPQMPAKFDFAAAGHSSTTQGLGAASVPFANATAGLMASDGGQSSNPETMFDDSAKEKIQSAIKDGKKVIVAGFSSQGGGHTERMMKPLGQAVGQGDTVVIALPPHWENDKGNEAKNLDKFSAQYEKAGANVVTVQADKAIWGFYHEDGPSDNFRILEEFAMKPQRDTDQTPLYGLAKDKARTGQGFMHKDIMQQVVNIAGKDNMDQIQVFEDMDPYLGKAAQKAGVPQDQVLGQSNHVLLLDAITDKSDAFLVKANGGSFDGMMATIDYDASVNKTASLGETLDKLGIKPDDKTVDVRKDMVATFMQHGTKIYPDDTAEVTKSGGVIVSRDATEDSIDRGVYLYMNSYTGPIAEHIKERLNPESDTPPALREAYEKTMFCICGGGTFSEDFKTDPNTSSSNAMHLAQAANFEGVTSAGFGTTSEAHYLIENDAYQGNFIVMPVEDQNEQEANAHDLLPKAFSTPENKERVAIADTTEELKAQMDDLVMSRATTTDALQQSGTTMGSMLEATHKPGSIADKAASLLQGTGEMSAQDAALLEENIWRANEPGRKEIRQINKVMIPVLKALSQGESQATIQMTAKDEPRTVNAADVVSSLNNPAKLRELTGVNITNQLARNLSDEIAEDLEPIMDLPEGAVRHYMVDHYMRGPYTEKFNLGY